MGGVCLHAYRGDHEDLALWYSIIQVYIINLSSRYTCTYLLFCLHVVEFNRSETINANI